MTGRVLAVDPGEKRLGLALSDPFRILATPLAVIAHKNVIEDCRKIIEYSCNHNAELILIGVPISSTSIENPQTRHAKKLAEILRSMSSIPVELWDESSSTKIAQKTALEIGIKQKKRSGHLDAQAAAVILQTFLDAQPCGRVHEE